MPPKKVANKKVPKLVKPPLKTPSKITVKIGSTGSKAPKKEKCVSGERKIELANEVALAQLQAQSTFRKSHKLAALPTSHANTQETVKKPMKKFTMVTTDIDSLEDFETTPEPKKKKRPGPKSKTMPLIKKTPNLNPLVLVRNKQWQVKGKIAKPIAKAKNSPKRNTQLKSVAVHLADVPSAADTAATAQACNNIASTPPTKPRGRPKGPVKRSEKTPATRKTLSAKEIKAAASMLEHALGIASQPHSRPNSVVSNRSNLSWTRDISTESSFSSGTTCITATCNDFVRFNNKMPLVQVENCAPAKERSDTSTLQPPSILPNINNVITHRLPPSVLSKDESSSSDSESSSSSSSSSDSELGGTNTMPELNLSTSSLTSRLPISDTNTDQYIEKIKNVLKNFHSDIRKFVSHDDDDTCTYSEIYECVDRELKAIPPVRKGVDLDFDAIIDKCDNFDRDLEALFPETCSPEKSAGITEQNKSGKKDKEKIEDSRIPSYESIHSQSSSPRRCRLRQNNDHNDSEAIFDKSCLVAHESAANSRDTSTDLPDKQLLSNITPAEASPTDSFKTFTSDNYNYLPFDRSDDAVNDDDDDALSLYAESISGMDSLRLDPVASVSNVSLHDVYVPEYSPTSSMPEKYIYRPTKIQRNTSNLAKESIEEGENISTTDYQEQEPDTKPKLIPACVSSSRSRGKKIDLEMLEDSSHISSHTDEAINITKAQVSSQTQRLFYTHQKMNPIKSTLYKGYCFFYIASQCRKICCRFPHDDIDPEVIKNRLELLSDDNLLSEYLLMCSYAALRKFCTKFVAECKRRNATRILVEMAIELGLGFIIIAEDLKKEVLETTLLHLNSINLDVCVDLLKFERKGTMMCDALLSCIADSQNFAQFKRAFVKLASLISELNRPVDIEVASSILMRVCILPGEEYLARGMLALMKITDVSIFETCYARSFEVQLDNINSDLVDLYLLAKKAALEGGLAQLEVMHSATPLLMSPREEARHTSPDTTNVEELPETKETIFKRTINDEALRSMFKHPASPVPKRFVQPRMTHSSRHGYNPSGARRGRNASRTPGARWAAGSQMIRRNMSRK